jgi:hypothetical protein
MLGRRMDRQQEDAPKASVQAIFIEYKRENNSPRKV